MNPGNQCQDVVFFERQRERDRERYRERDRERESSQISGGAQVPVIRCIQPSGLDNLGLSSAKFPGHL